MNRTSRCLVCNSSMVFLLIIPRSATMHIRVIEKRSLKRSTMGTRVFTSVVLPGHSSQQIGRPVLSKTAPTTICLQSGR